MVPAILMDPVHAGLRQMTTNGLIHSDPPTLGRRCALGLAIILAVSLLTSCQERLPAYTGSVQLKGSETLRPLLIMCAEDFMSRRPHVDVIVQGGGSGVGIAALLHGMVDVAMASRELTDKERQYADRQGLKVQTFDLAFDGIALVVHPNNPVEALTIEDLRDIFAGVRQSWQDANGAPHPITALSRAAGSGTALLFRQRVFGDGDDGGIAQQMPTNEAVVAEVSSRLWAIGYTSFGAVQTARGRVKTVALQSSPQAPAVAPTPETIRERSYPLARILHLYTASEPTGVTRDFIDFCLSPRGQELVRKAGYLPMTQ
jgi:phosphate transport system substrate-binding protein